MIIKESLNKLRKKRHRRFRKKVSGTPERPRLVVFRSLKYIYAQIIDDIHHKTLVAASSLEPSFKAEKGKIFNQELSQKVGRKLGERARNLGIKKVVFDRGGLKYHGKVAALAQGVREMGIEF